METKKLIINLSFLIRSPAEPCVIVIIMGIKCNTRNQFSV